MTTKIGDEEQTGRSLTEMLRDPAVLIALQALKAATSEYLDRDEVARILGVHLRTVDNYSRKGLLRPLRIRGTRAVRFRRADVLALLED